MTNLTQYEQSFVDRTGFWMVEKENQRLYYSEQKALAKRSSKEKEVFTISLREGEFYVPGANTVLNDYMSIASLFSNKELIGSFLDFLFSVSLDYNINGLSPFFYHKESQVYNFDYNYILFCIISWCVQELEANEADMYLFLRRFKPGTNPNFLGSNHFLINIVFGGQYDLMGSKFINPLRARSYKIARDCYCNSIIIGTETGEELFFQGVPFNGNMILRYCSRPIVIRLLEERDSLNIKQIYFGKDAKKYRAEKIFFEINFPD